MEATREGECVEEREREMGVGGWALRERWRDKERRGSQGGGGGGRGSIGEI